ncbi:MAG TPA: T9SS type A sorting domain-containing protein [Chitinophagales bacterium]|nr:T9SS type A sorting domain-containing protein [Chitinophagales bacterium]HMX03936.1 T9SS type A sorting domain-containing protein [Chitinophagales bacterium]HMZ87849.1 T9SS type A sorting domain-containing protein [Chitinophagales bacterium]HNA56578.1 T9SS type A sorting domain-containing protein [Chitinophagales bacterium]HNE45722.1 T9SS type A sorting domain-containing protein [Chitinophagales bacterium]
MKHYLIATLCLTFATQSVSARILGGELWYEQTAADQYIIKLTWYREYEPELEPVFWLGIYNNTDYTLIDTVAAIEIDRSIVDSNYPTCVGMVQKYDIERLDFSTPVTLPENPDGYVIVIMGNTRTEEISNILLPGLRGLTLYTTVPGNVNNSAPSFNNPPVWYACEDQSLNMDLGASELDGDDLSYALVPALNADYTEPFFQSLPTPPPFSELSYLGALSPTNPFPSATTIEIDPSTGMLTGLPTTEGVYIITVEVTETRLGIELSKTRRDIILIVEDCTPTMAEVDLGSEIYQCNDTHVFFECETEPWAGYYWDFGDGIIQTWDIYEHTYPALGDYELMYIANYDLPCADTFYLPVHIRELSEDVLSTDLLGNPENCFYDTIQLIGEPGFVAEWQDVNTGLIIGTGSPLPVTQFSGDLLATAYYYDDDFCFASDTVSAYFFPDNTPLVKINQDNPQWFLYCDNAFDPFVETLQWFKDDMPIPGAINPNLPLTSCGSYYARITDTHACVFESEATYYCNSEIEGAETLFFEVSPNPSSGSFSLTLPNTDPVTIRIYNNLGEKVYQIESAGNAVININTESLAGLYHVIIAGETYVKELPVMIN